MAEVLYTLIMPTSTSFKNEGARLCNKLDTCIKCVPSIATFKLLSKKLL